MVALRKNMADERPPRPHCTVREAAEYAQCSVGTIRRWIELGVLDAKRPLQRGSSRWRVSVESLERLVAKTG